MVNRRETEPENANQASDGSLLRGIRTGDEQSAASLFDRYIGRLQALAKRQLAAEVSGRVDSEDITQSIFRTLFRRLQDGQYSVPQGDTIWRLLTTIALNKIRKVGAHHRAAKRDIRRSSGLEVEHAEPMNASSDEATLQALRMTIDELLEGMSESQRHIIELRLESHDVASIAGQTKRSKRTVERVLQGFRQRLGDILDVDSPTESDG